MLAKKQDKAKANKGGAGKAADKAVKNVKAPKAGRK